MKCICFRKLLKNTNNVTEMQLSGKYNVTYSEEHHNDVAKGRSDGVDKCTGT
jgi:hypothetical protein